MGPAWWKANGAEMSLKVKRCLWNCKCGAKNRRLLNWSTLSRFTLSTCNLLICQIFTHERFYCPLWATVGKLCSSFQCILGEKKWRQVLVRKQQPKAGRRQNDRKKNAASSRGKCRVHKKTLSPQNNQYWKETQQWSGGRWTGLNTEEDCTLLFLMDSCHVINEQNAAKNKCRLTSLQTTVSINWPVQYNGCQFISHPASDMNSLMAGSDYGRCRAP